MLAALTTDTFADTPLGWINNNNPSAYTNDHGELEIAASIQAINGAIDFLDLREEFFANNKRLQGKSGDLGGYRFDVNCGVTGYLTVFARLQKSGLTVDLGEITSANVLGIDDSLNATQQEIGFKWTLFESNLLESDNRRNTLSVMGNGYRNATMDFDLVVDRLDGDNLTVFFKDPTSFSVSNLNDEGWATRSLYSL